jgi:polysaccharide export outer membrane protein
MRAILVRSRLVGLALCLAISAFAQQRNDTPASGTNVDASGLKGPMPDYEVCPEDVLEISVWKEEGLSKEVLVRPDGGISFPLAGDMQAAGKTAQQIQLEITRRLTKFIAQPVVSVTVLKVVGNKIYVIGRVNKPGEYVVGRYVNVLQALSMAGGLTPFAAENDIKVLRKGDGWDMVFPFRYSEVRTGHNLDQNIILKGGDVVVVP